MITTVTHARFKDLTPDARVDAHRNTDVLVALQLMDLEAMKAARTEGQP